MPGVITASDQQTETQTALHHAGWPTYVPMLKLTSRPGTPQQKTWQLRNAITIIGSRTSAGVRLRHDAVSKTHAAVICDGTEPIVCDLVSRNGTVVGGKRVTWAFVKDGDTMQIGPYDFDVQSQPLPGSRGKNFESGQFQAARPRQALHLYDGQGHEVFTIAEGVAVVGTRGGADLIVESDVACPAAALLIPWQSEWAVYDLAADEDPRTRLNQQMVRSAILSSGDQIMICGHEYQVRLGKEQPTPFTARAAGDDRSVGDAPAAAPSSESSTTEEAANMSTTNQEQVSQAQGAATGLSSIEEKLASIQNGLAASYQQLHDLQGNVESRSAAIAQREKEIEAREQTLASLTAELEARSGAVDQQRGELEQQSASVQKQREEAEQLRAELEQERQQLAEQKASAAAESAQLDAKRAEVEQLTQQAAEQQQQMEQQKAEFVQQQQALQEQQQQVEIAIHNMEADRQAVEAQKTQNEAAQAELAQSREDLEKQIVQVHQDFNHLAELESAVRQRSAEVAEKEAQLQELLNHLAEREAAMQQFKAALDQVIAAFHTELPAVPHVERHEEPQAVTDTPTAEPEPETPVQDHAEPEPVMDSTAETPTPNAEMTRPEPTPVAHLTEPPSSKPEPVAAQTPQEEKQSSEEAIDENSLDPATRERLRVLRRIYGGTKSDAELLKQIQKGGGSASQSETGGKKGGWFWKK